MPRCARPAAAILSLILLGNLSPVSAARPLLDLHKWDAYFALFAPDSNVPWKPALVRLDTYSGAAVDFAAFQVEPTEVIVAGNAPARSIQGRRARRVAQWRFLPGGGYQFRSSFVPVPLGNREGFFVVEARRANVAEQVWINRTRVGIASKESPGEVMLYGADLGTGKTLAHMRVSLLRSGSFITRFTDEHGILRINDRPRPAFALGEWGASRAFLSLFPQPPMPAALAGMALESATVRAGDELKVTGFARVRSNQDYRAAHGVAALSLRYRGAIISTASVPLDEAGSFATGLRIPPLSATGDYTVLLAGAGASAGASVHVAADSGNLALALDSPCARVCDLAVDPPVTLTARRDGKPSSHERVHLRVVRSPHIRTDRDLRGDEWGNTVIADDDITTGPDGSTVFHIPAPTDGLSSTYGVTATQGGATAATRLSVAAANGVVSLQLDSSTFSADAPIGFAVRAAGLGGEPLAGEDVTVRLQHGANAQEQILHLNTEGAARGSFGSPNLGSSLVVARMNGRYSGALDAAEAIVIPQTLAGVTRQSSDVALATDHASYDAGDRVSVTARSGGGHGDCLLTYETPFFTQAALTPVHLGGASNVFLARNVGGETKAGALFVYDGEMQWTTVPLHVMGRGRSAAAPHSVSEIVPANGDIRLKIDEAPSPARTIVVRLSAVEDTGSARFESLPDLLTVGGTATQVSAQSGRWHAWVSAGGARAGTFEFGRRATPQPQDLSIADARSMYVTWHVLHPVSGRFSVPAPATAGRYFMSVLEFDPDGSVGVQRSWITVR
ncbi:MAG: hypothetical protein DLM50_00760 [Candidatus Meridianibacter frigidus]|nr:MAG: hypothetical protein DLM50_00760 [Candidatus Eremiobacteraeota bacterium]